ncbi:extracellular solute-binding protein [Streptacidiphilus carbonis]|uniref:extracellular solute-binding protein n=1 Tax=Streptacidiphilus carbonis TaxID=105422 RepID=UPI0005A84172|nr:extracellular solute-binding protein [Streptacidiphilus carbonis]
MALGLLGVAAATSGCSADALASGKTRLRYWNLFGGGDGVNMQAMEAAFSKAHPQIDLEANTLAWGAPYYTKLAMAGAGGRAPEIAVLHLARLPGFAPGRLLDPWDLDLLGEFGIHSSDFPDSIWKRGTVDGKQFAVPLDTHPFVMYYNTDIAKKAGLLGTDGKIRTITGTDQFLDVLRTVKRTTGQQPITFETLGPGCINPWRLFSTFYAQAGGTVLSADAKRLTIDDAKALKVLTFMQQLTHEGLAVQKTDVGGAIALFNSGKSGFFLDGEWDVSTFKSNTSLPFGMARIPALFGPVANAQADCHSFVLPHESGRGGAPNRAAHQFAAWMLKNSLMWAEGGHVPAYSPVRDSDAYHKLEPQSEYASVANDVALDPVAWFAGSASAMWIDLGAAFSQVLTGSSSPQQGLDQAKSALRKLIATPNPFGGAAA